MKPLKLTLFLGTSLSTWILCLSSFVNAATLTSNVILTTTVSGRATAGSRSQPGQVTAAQNYMNRYSGPSEFRVNYTICLNEDGTFDTGTATLTTITYTSSGRERRSSFATETVDITGITETSGTIESFTITDTDWYPSTAPGASRMTGESISGTVGITSGVGSTFTSSYANRNNDVIYTYTTTGNVKPNNPFPDPLPDEFGDIEIFSPLPVPEYTSNLSIFVLGLLGAGSTLRCKIKLSKDKN